MMRKYCVLGAAALLGAASPAAAVTICLGGGCAAQPNSNVLVDMGVTGTTVTGTLNNAPGIVSFTSIEDLINNANGQARVGAVDGVLNNPITIALNGGIINALELDINALTNGNVTFSFTGGNSNGVVTGPFDIGKNGSNFFNAFNGSFSSVTLSFGDGGTVQDIRQVRMTTGALAGVPEPATWALMIMGFGAVAGAMRRRSAGKDARFA